MPAPRPRSRLDLVWDVVIAAGWPDERPIRAFFDLLIRAVEQTKAEKVLVASAGECAVWESVIAAAFPAVTVFVSEESAEASAEHARLSALAPFDVVVHAADVDGQVQARTFRRIFWHLREGGVYLTPCMVASEPEPDVRPVQTSAPLPNEDGWLEPPYQGDVWRLVAEAESARIRDFRAEADGSVPFRDIRGLGRHLTEVRVVSKMLWIRNQKRAQAKLTESEASQVLAARAEYGVEIDQRPGGEVRARAPYRHNLAADPYFVPTMTAPPVRLRRYERPVCSRGQIVTSGDFLWPDTFRHHLYPRLTNIYVEETAPRFGYVRRDLSAADDLPGSWFHLDSEWPGHFGHLMTEQLGRLWAWEETKRRDPDVKVLLTLQHDRDPQVLHGFELELLSVFGITADDVHVFTRPCRPEVLYSATSMFSVADYVHPDLVEVWDRVGDTLAGRAGIRDTPERFFCTRPASLKRACHNLDAVEDFFRDAGFAVVSPEDYSLAEQIALFRGATAVAGFVGSALFTLAFCPRPTPVFTVGPVTYTARNEHLICAARGHPLVSAWSAADLAHRDGSWSQEAFSAGFTVDLADEGRFLADRITELG